MTTAKGTEMDTSQTENIRRWLSAHAMLLLALILVGSVCSLHHFLLIQRHGVDYTPFGDACMMSYDETIYYAPMVAEKLKGNWFSTNPHYREGKERLSMPAWKVPAWTVALIGTLTGSDVTRTFILCDIIFPMLCCLLMYRVLRQLLPDRSYAASIAGIVILANDFLTRQQFGLRYFTPPTVAEGGFPLDPLFFSRTFSPSVVLPFMLLALILLMKMAAGRGARYVLFTGVASGLLFYTYFFYWSAMAAIGGVLFLAALIRRDTVLLKRIIGAGLVAGVVGSYFWYCFFSLHGTLVWEMNTLKGGWGKSVRPEWWFLIASIVAAIWIGYACRKSRKTQVWIAALVAGGVLLIAPATGLPLIQPDHWRLQFFKFFLLLSAGAAAYAMLFVSIRKRFAKAAFAMMMICLCGSAFIGVHRQRLFTRRHSEAFTLASHREALSFLRTLPANSVILTGDALLNMSITFYSGNYPFCRQTSVEWIGPEELLARHWVAREVLGRSGAEYPTLYFTKGAGARRLRIILAGASDDKSEGEILRLLDHYTLDYLVLRTGKPHTQLAQQVFPQCIYSGENFLVYSRRPVTRGSDSTERPPEP